MTRISVRLLCNLIYVHLAPGRAGHADKCTDRRCTVDCPQQRFHAWLDGPLTRADMRAKERAAERADRLLRGDIPA